MRELSRDIIADLLPAYYSGECSDETRQAVEEYFIADPEFAAKAGITAQPLLPDVPVPKSVTGSEGEALAHTRRLQSWRAWLLAGAIFFTLSVFTFTFGEGNLSWRLVESPLAALANGLLGVMFWAAYYMVRRKWNAVMK